MFRSLCRICRFAGVSAAALAFLLVTPGAAGAADGAGAFRRIPVQYIAALGAPEATSGAGAETWGIWRVDPGPRGEYLSSYPQIAAADGRTAAGWRFDAKDWWLEEHGLIMEQPDFPLPPGRYLVTGGRETVAPLTVHPTGPDGVRRWELADGATLHDVTHLGCRSARYTPPADGGQCTPAKARQEEFPVDPGAEMPAVEGCAKQDYAVLFVIGIAE